MVKVVKQTHGQQQKKCQKKGSKALLDSPRWAAVAESRGLQKHFIRDFRRWQASSLSAPFVVSSCIPYTLLPLVGTKTAVGVA